MTATLVLPGTAPEADWLDARRRGVTASEIAVIMGISPGGQNSAYALYHRKRGELPDQPDSDALERGRILEPYVARKFGEGHPELTVSGDGRTLYCHPDRAWQLGTPDRLLTDDPGHLAGLECKTDAGHGEDWGDAGTDEVPVHYRCQCLWNMDIFGASTWYLDCLFVQPWKTRVYEMTMNADAAADLELMRDAALGFLDRVDRGDPPDPDWRPATSAALRYLHPTVEDRDVTVRPQMAISYQAAYRRYKAAERRKDEMTNKVLAVIGSGRRAVHSRTGDVIATRTAYDVKEHVRKAGHVNKLAPPRGTRESAS